MSPRDLIHQQARDLRNNMTDAEKSLWQQLRSRRFFGHRFRRQKPLGPYIVDFVCLPQRVIIEIDGGQHDLDRHVDAARDRWLGQQGYTVLRFWNNEIGENLTGVLQTIAAALGEPWERRHSMQA